MMRGKDVGMVEALLEGGRVLGRDEVAVTMLDSEVNAVAVLVAVGVSEVALFDDVVPELTTELAAELAAVDTTELDDGVL